MRKRYIFLVMALLSMVAVILVTISGEPSNYEKKPIGKPHISVPPHYDLTSLDETFLEDFDTYISGIFKQTNTPGGAVAIVKNGTVVYKKAFGLKSISKEDSVDTETLFRIASVSKGFSSILAGLIVKDSLLKWSDPIANYLNYQLLDSANNITVRHILSHTAGFPYQAYSTLVEDELPRDTMIKALLKIPLSRSPGDIHSYQNVAYSMIENILESVTEEPFNQLMQDRIFTPLHMDNASITYDSMVNSTDWAQPHGYSNRKFAATKIDRSYYNVAAAGGINTNITDMAKWLNAVLGNVPDIIPTAVIDQVFQPVIRIRVKNPYFSHLGNPRKGYYGMGWRIIEYPSDTLVYHGGYANGYKSGIALDRNKKVGICVLTNAPSKFSNLALTEFFRKYYKTFGHDSIDSVGVDTELEVSTQED